MKKKAPPHKMTCLKACRGRLDPVFIAETYKRRGSQVVVTVTGIPALECSICHERLTDLQTFGEVERFVAPVLESGRTRGRLPTPHVTIEFPQFARSAQRSA